MKLRLTAIFLMLALSCVCPGPAVAAGAAPDYKELPRDRGWAATVGGQGGRIIHVTNLSARGPGSFAEAVTAKGPRIVVFDVGGIIDLNKSEIAIGEPFLTVAGQTAPSPGVTFIKGGIDVVTHDVILQHIRVRPGEAGAAKKSGWEVDAIATAQGARDVVIDHCSVSWATDENLSASGPRFEGANLAEWRKNTSHRITFSHCIIAEGLADSTHGKGAHSKGSLIHDNASDIAIIGNLYASNVQRNPLFKGGAKGAIVNNYIYNPGSAAVHYGLVPQEWGERPYATGQLVVVGNVMKRGPNTREGLPLFYSKGNGPLELFMADNLTLDRAGKREHPPRLGLSEKLPKTVKVLKARPAWPEGLQALPAGEVEAQVLENAGARPWDRDPVDRRIVRQTREGTGRVIDSEQDVEGYPRAAAFWPQFHGPNRDNVSAETGLLKRWPKGGPPLLWTAKDLGDGYSTVAIAGGRIYTAGNLDGKTVVTALDMNGARLWRAEIGPAWLKPYPGTRGTPTVDGDRVYYESPHGDVACLRAETGEEIWARNILKEFNGKNIQWGLAESVLIDGARAICCPGGATCMVALDKLTGETVWQAPAAAKDGPGYASPQLAEHEGLRIVLTLTSKAMIGVNADTGALLWRVPHVTYADENVLTPLFHGGHIFVTTLGHGAVKWKLEVGDGGTSVSEAWRSKQLDSHHDAVVLVDGYVYGCSLVFNKRKWVCLDWETGQKQYAADGVGRGCVTYADGMLYTLSEKGVMGLAPATPERHEVVSRFSVPSGGDGPYWAHPVVSGARLYLRHATQLHAYDLKPRP